MPEVFTIVGLAGSGKTSYSMSILEQKLKSGIPLHQIGYSSFSRAACIEAADRASKITGVDAGRLQKDFFYRTIHSAVLRLLGISGKLIVDPDSASGKQWYIDVFGAPRGGERGTLSEKIDEAISWWDVCRARLSRLLNNEPDLSGQVTPVTGIPPRTTIMPPKIGDPVTADVKHWDSASQCFTQAPTRPPKDSDLSLDSSRPIYIDGKTESNNVNTFNYYLDSMVAHVVSTINRDKNIVKINNSPYKDRASPKKTDAGFDGFGVTEKDIRSVNSQDSDSLEKYGKIIRDYEDAKRNSEKLDFTDILMKYTGITVNSELEFRQGYQEGSVPEEIHTWIIDEYQDCSALLDLAAQRLSETAQELYLLGDAYQAVYGFSGSDAKLFAHRVCEAGENGRNMLLNRTWRNPDSVVDWGEAILREDAGYVERKPISEAGEGSVGMMHLKDLIAGLPELAAADTMILARAWFALSKIKDRLDQLCIPWVSCQEQKSSRWESPAKIAFVITMRALIAGDKISEQDWRRITTELPQKIDGAEIFSRGTKAKWKKFECSGKNTTTLQGLTQWGAAEGFAEFVTSEKWRRDTILLIDSAIEKYGIDVVRKPRIKIGSCHSVKGMEATNVFCLATSSKKAAESDPFEEVCLRYVTVTRSSKNFRVVVDLYEHAQGKPLFLPCPKNYWTFGGMPDDLGIEDLPDPIREDYSGEVSELGQQTRNLGSQISRRNLRTHRDAGYDSMRQRTIPGDRIQDSGPGTDDDATLESETDPTEWWRF